MKNNLSSFPHSTEEYRRGENLIVRDKYGFEGEAKYYILKSLVAEADGCMLFLPDPNVLYRVGNDLRMSVEELAGFIDYLVSKSIICRKDDYIYFPDLLGVLEYVNKNRKRAREHKITHNSHEVTSNFEQIKLNKTINNKGVDKLITRATDKKNASPGELRSIGEVITAAGLTDISKNNGQDK